MAFPCHNKQNQIREGEKQERIITEGALEMAMQQGMHSALVATCWTIQSRKQFERAFRHPFGNLWVKGIVEPPCK